MKKFLKILKWLGISILILIAAFFCVRAVGKAINNKTPKGGINESMYIDVNGTKQWIQIYGEDVNNPVLLYLHGGPGSSTSELDYAFTRKWADVYTVVTWDQRNCGKSYDASQNNIVLTKELFMEDGKQVTEFILNYLSKDNLTLLGHSWGSLYGANLAMEYPEYYTCFIGTGQLIDPIENEERLIEEAIVWANGDAESLAFLEQLSSKKMDIEYYKARNAILQKYGYDMMVNGSDYNLITTVIFNPNYSMIDWIKYVQKDMTVYLDFTQSSEFTSFSLKNRYDYQIPYYNINGDKDYQTNHNMAQEYFDLVNAPDKQMYIMENMTHGLLESDSEGFSKILHQIAQK